MAGGACCLAAIRCVKSQLVAESLLFASIGKPVVHSHLCHQVRSQSRQLGGGNPPLKALSPGEETLTLSNTDTAESLAQRNTDTKGALTL